MITRNKLAMAAAVAILALAALSSAVSATPPSGQTTTDLAVGTLSSITQVNTDRIKFQTKGDVDVYVFNVNYAPGAYSGWHTHPGVVFVVVKTGSVVRTVGCQSWTFSAGQSFVESDEQGPGQVQNASTTDPAVLGVTQIVPKGSVRRFEADPPSC
jgi:quercetin dioxygenase-like cupin family protein